MDRYVELIGAERVQNAATSMTASAARMSQAAGHIDESLRWFLQRFDELVTRMEQALPDAPTPDEEKS